MTIDPDTGLVLGMLLVMSGILASAVAALYWAASHGEFHNLDEKSHVIFGDDEPVGQVTDAFPEKKTDAQAQACDHNHNRNPTANQ